MLEVGFEGGVFDVVLVVEIPVVELIGTVEIFCPLNWLFASMIADRTIEAAVSRIDCGA